MKELKMKKTLIIAALVLSATTAYAGSKKADLSKLTAPTENAGINLEVLAQNDLEAQIPAFAGYDIRARKITFEPGAKLQTHSHAERPGFVYILEGEVVETRNGKPKVYKAGDVWIEDAETDHWLRNISDKPAQETQSGHLKT
ncbi:hypothetical protein GQR58_028022 [Nymphon striatum]|nr:hypothetical protein GQR58_028022 [Nymphon striatum]